MREDLAANAAILKRLAEIDRTLLQHDTALHDIYQKLRPLLLPPEHKRLEIGFHAISKEADDTGKAKSRRKQISTAGERCLKPRNTRNTRKVF